MKEIDFLEAVGKVDKRFVEECITYKQSKKTNKWIKFAGVAAACFVMLVTTVLLINHIDKPVIIDEKDFYIQDGVLISYTGNQKDITIPETVKTITDFAFIENKNANKIETVTLGASVEKVEINAFAGLSNLEKIIVSENNTSFVNNNGLVMTTDNNMLLHYEREKETFFEIPDGVRLVGAHAVQETELEEIDFGNNLKYIGYNAFLANYNLKAINLPDSVTYIGKNAFSKCSSAINGYIPSGVEFDSDAFDGVPFYISQLVNMTVGEIEAVYGPLIEEYSEQGPGLPVYSLERVQGVLLVFHGWQYGIHLENTMMPTEILVTESKTAIGGMSVSDDISSGADQIREYEPSMNWDYTGVFIKIKYHEFYVTYRMPLEVLDFTKWGDNYDEMEKEYLENPKGNIIQIRIEPIK